MNEAPHVCRKCGMPAPRPANWPNMLCMRCQCATVQPLREPLELDSGVDARNDRIAVDAEYDASKTRAER